MSEVFAPNRARTVEAMVLTTAPNCARTVDPIGGGTVRTTTPTWARTVDPSGGRRRY